MNLEEVERVGAVAGSEGDELGLLDVVDEAGLGASVRGLVKGAAEERVEGLLVDLAAVSAIDNVELAVAFAHDEPGGKGREGRGWEICEERTNEIEPCADSTMAEERV